MGVGDNIRQLRQWAKLTQKELADLVGVPENHIKDIEAGAAYPRLLVFQRIAQAFGLTISDLRQTPLPAYAKIQRDNKMGERLRSIRESRHMTRQELSEVLGYLQKEICDIEEGRTKPTIELIRRLANVLQIPIEMLTGAVLSVSVDNTTAPQQQKISD